MGWIVRKGFRFKRCPNCGRRGVRMRLGIHKFGGDFYICRYCKEEWNPNWPEHKPAVEMIESQKSEV